MTDSSDREPTTKFWLGIAVAVGLALALRLWGLNNNAYEVDELYELRHQSTDLAELITREDSFPPLGRWLFGGWVAAFGDASARGCSTAAGLLGVLAIGLLGREVGGTRIGITAAALAAINANHIWYSQQCRPYAFYFAAASLAMAAAWRLRRDQSVKHWLLFAATSWLTLATHYYAAILIALLFLMVFLTATWPQRRRAVLAALAFAVACLPLAYCLSADIGREQKTYTAIDFDREVYAYTYLTLVSGFTLGPSMYGLREMTPFEGIVAMAPWAAGVFAASGLLIIGCLRRLAWRDSAWLAVLLIAPPLIAGGAAVASPTGYSYRYVGWILTPLLITAAAGVDLAWSRRGVWRITAILGGAMLAGLSLSALVNRHHAAEYRIDDFYRVQQILAQEPAPVLAAPHYFADGAAYYLEKQPYFAASIEPGEEQDWPTVLARLSEELQGAQHYWIVTQSFPEDDSRREVRDALITKLKAQHVERVTWTIDVYRASANVLREVTSD